MAESYINCQLLGFLHRHKDKVATKSPAIFRLQVVICRCFCPLTSCNSSEAPRYRGHIQEMLRLERIILSKGSEVRCFEQAVSSFWGWMQMATVGYFMQLLSMENWYHPVAGSTSWFSLWQSHTMPHPLIQTTLSLKMTWWTGNPGKGAKRKHVALTQKPLQLCKTFITKYQHLSSFMDRSAQVGPPSLWSKSEELDLPPMQPSPDQASKD